MIKPFCGVVTVMQSGKVIENKIRYSTRLRDIKRVCRLDFEDYKKEYPFNFIKIQYLELSEGRYVNRDIEQHRTWRGIL